MFTPTAFSSSARTSVVTDRGGESSRGWMCISSGTHESTIVAAPKDWEVHEARERSFIEAEEQRLRYVAMTRARNYFVFIPPSRGDGLFAAEALQRHGIPAAPVFEAPKKRGINIPSTLPDAVSVAGDPRQRCSALREHSFARYNASLMHTGPPPQTAAVGRGAAFGTLMHRLLQQAVKHPECSIQDVAAALLSREAIDNVSIDTVMQMYNDVRAHAFWTRIQNAERRMTELPFALPQPSEQDLPGILRGDIDLVFLDETGWNIVDYKTDAVGDMLSAFTDYYAPQLRLYCDAWKQLTGEKATGYLWFLTPNEIVQVC
jgi:ATP-dependent helicase/nuclease subunit A